MKPNLPFNAFLLNIDGKKHYWIHRFKTDDDFRKDLKSFGSESKNADPATIKKGLHQFLENEGYTDIKEFVVAEYNATILSTRSRLIEIPESM